MSYEQEAVDLINACYEHGRKMEARWAVKDRMGKPEMMYYRAVQSMDLAITGLHMAANRWRDLDEPVLAKFCKEKAALIEQMKPGLDEFALAAELLKETP